MPAHFPMTIELSSLSANSQNGFILNGLVTGGKSGYSVASAGDVNGDGIDDLIIGGALSSTAQCHVVFGDNSIGSSGTIELSALNGSNGFKLNGIGSSGGYGVSVAGAGDVNADGFHDLIVGASHLPTSTSGRSYIIFGEPSIGSSGAIYLSGLNGNNGFKVNGVHRRDYLGNSVASAGDVNVDGVADFIIGASAASPYSYAGKSYVLFGAVNLGNSSTIKLSNLNGDNGYVVNGAARTDHSGRSVSEAGDINGDGIGDLIIGANKADPHGTSSGQSYVVFGGVSVGSSGTFPLASLNGANGFKLNGMVGTQSGRSVSQAGDVNGDGIGDLIIGAYYAGPHGSQSGQSYVVFGGLSVGSTGTIELSSLNGANGFKINGIAAGDRSGVSVASAGDINDDGISDLIVGAYHANPNGDYSGQSYLILGDVDVGRTGTIELSSLNGVNGFTVNGIAAGDRSGYSVASAGDINGDGIADLIIGAYYASPRGANSGQSYVIFGSMAPPEILQNHIEINQGETITLTNDMLSLNITNPQRLAVPFYHVSDTTFCQFEYNNNPSVAITSFSQEDINQGKVMLKQLGKPAEPSFNLQIYKGLYRSNLIKGNITFSAYPELINNNLVIKEGGNVTFSALELLATDITNSASSLEFSVSSLFHGYFISKDNPEQVILQFPQLSISEGKIQFFQDGSSEPPSYRVSVSNGHLQTIPNFAIVSFISLNDLPQIVTNSFVFNPTGSTLISNANLQATDEETLPTDLQFILSNQLHGHFERTAYPGIMIDQFQQREIGMAGIQFFADGSRELPAFNIAVDDGILQSDSVAANVKFAENSSSVLTNNKQDVTTRNVLIGTMTTAGAITALLVCYVGMGFLQQRRLQAAARRENEGQARLYQEVIIPIAKAVFKQIKVTGFMNYISKRQIEAYIAEIASLINKIQRLGIDIEIQHMNPEKRTELLDQITKQIKRHLTIETGKCNRACFASFFKPQVTPEQVGEKAQAIAQSVYDALLGGCEESVINIPEGIGLMNLTEVTLAEEKFTTNYFQMS